MPFIKSLLTSFSTALVLGALPLASGLAQVAPMVQGTAHGLPIDPKAALSSAPRSGAVSQEPGEIYTGPGPMTVGYLGAKRQIVLPPGSWVLLATEPRKSGHNQPVDMTSMVFGRIKDGKLDSLVSYLFNDKVTPSNLQWRELGHCEESPPPSANARKLVHKDASWRACGWVVRNERFPAQNDPGWARAQASAQALGLTWPEGPVLQSRAWAGGVANDFLGVRRIDMAASPEAFTHRVTWLESFLPVFVEGAHKKILADEIEPGKRPRTVLALTD